MHPLSTGTRGRNGHGTRSEAQVAMAAVTRGRRRPHDDWKLVSGAASNRLPTRHEFDFLAMLSKAGPEGVTRPKSAICAQLGCDRRTFMLLVERLKASGLVGVYTNFTQSGQQLANTYRLSSAGRTLVVSCNRAGWSPDR